MSTRRALVPRVDRAAVVLLETCDFCVADAVAAVLLAAAAHERAEIIASRCVVVPVVREAITKVTSTN
jgi:hypothetical protein